MLSAPSEYGTHTDRSLFCLPEILFFLTEFEMNRKGLDPPVRL